MVYGIILAEGTLPPPNSYQSVGWVLFAVAALCVALNQILKFVDRVKQKPHPGDVQREAAEKFVGKPEFHSVIGELKSEDLRLHQKIGGVDRGASQKTDDKVTALTHQIGGVAQKVARLEATTEIQNGELSEIKKDIKAMPAQIVALMKNTGAI